MKKKNAILTFDYELFLGEQTGSLERSVLEPTRHVIDILKANNGKAIFFIDTAWLLFIRENSPADFSLVSGQIADIINAGSSVELHFHPQWLKAFKTGDIIKFHPDGKYRLHSLTGDEIQSLFRDGTELLESITLQKITCFRAGGYCVEPFHQIEGAFRSAGIKFDFSVVPGLRLKRGFDFDFDFTGVPDLPYYPFKSSVKTEDHDGDFIEIPSLTYQNNPLYQLSNKLVLRLKGDRFFGDGKGMVKYSSHFLDLIRRGLSFQKALLSLDSTSNILFKLLVRYHFNGSDPLVIISHPKTLSDEGLLNLTYIVKNCNTLNSNDLNALTRSGRMNRPELSS